MYTNYEKISNLTKALNGFYAIKNIDDHNLAKKEAYAFLMTRKDLLISLITYQTFGLIMDRIDPDNGPGIEYKPSIINEHIALLNELEMWNDETNYYSGSLKAEIEHLANTTKDIKLRIMINQTIKGYIDLYGVISLKDLTTILNKNLNLSYNEDDLIDIINSSLLIKRYADIKNSYLARKEIIDDLDFFIKRINCIAKDFTYAPFDSFEAMQFANDFNIGNNPIDFDHNINDIIGFKQKIRNIELTPLDTKDGTREKDAIYPKWLLKGHAYYELVKKIGKDNVENYIKENDPITGLDMDEVAEINELDTNKVFILGAGTWGTALANLLASKGIDVYLWSRFEEECIKLRTTRKHPNLPNSILNDEIKFTATLEELHNCGIVMFATPSLYVRATAELIKPHINPNQIFVDVSKGIEKDSLFTMTEVIKSVLGKNIKTVALSGPTHAEEVALLMPTLIVAASKSLAAARKIQEVFSTKYFRVYTQKDVLGVELSGALKNIVALAAGISCGLGYGDNAKAAIITRGLTEITRLGIAMGCKKSTFAGLTGIGDIVVTATSMHSRNNKAGILIGQGYSIEKTLKEVGMVVEGINALDAAVQLEEKYQVDMPITHAVYNIVKKGKDVKQTVDELFARSLKEENI